MTDGVISRCSKSWNIGIPIAIREAQKPKTIRKVLSPPRLAVTAAPTVTVGEVAPAACSASSRRLALSREPVAVAARKKQRGQAGDTR